MKARSALVAVAALAAGFVIGALWRGAEGAPLLLAAAAALAVGCLVVALLIAARVERARREERVERAAEALALRASLKAEVDGYKRTLDRRAGNIRALVEARQRAGDPDPAFEITPQLAEILNLPPLIVFPANLGKLHLLAPAVAADLTRFHRLIEDARASLDIRHRNWRKRAEVFEDLSRVAESASQGLAA
jgi:hypothetical protein